MRKGTKRLAHLTETIRPLQHSDLTRLQGGTGSISSGTSVIRSGTISIVTSANPSNVTSANPSVTSGLPSGGR